MADYKQIAVWNERRFREKCDILEIDNARLKDLLYNAICFMEETQSNYGSDEDVHEYILDYLGMKQKEYSDIMGEQTHDNRRN